MNNNLTYREMQSRLDKQAIYVEFADLKLPSLDDSITPGMRAILQKIDIESDKIEEGPVLHLFFDFSGFEEYNTSYAIRKNKRLPSLVMFEVGSNPLGRKIDFYVFENLDAEPTIFKIIDDVGCDQCEGDEALLHMNGVSVFLDRSGKIDVFVDDENDARASGHLNRCPNCGRQFPVLRND